ncbi:MAG: DUF2914 domain-containing protein [Fibrobacter sp.]|jgi:hypothetical protein|nr:DUF2914 domain-containing protein [Fibrobacter sp.]
MMFNRIKPFIPATAFFGGFIWDSLTIGRVVSSSDLLLLSVYFILSLGLILLLAKIKQINVAETPDERASAPFISKFCDDRWVVRFTWVIQFCFGNLFSALVICYFKSSGSTASLLFVLLLVGFLVGNEFFQKFYSRFGFNIALFCLLGTMFLNFAVPHLVHRLGAFWFLLSTILSLLLCYGIWYFSRQSRRVLIVPGIISVFLATAYFLNWIAPVPLVLKQQEACVQFSSKTYECLIEKPSFWVRRGISLPSLHWDPVQKNEVYFVSSVFAPSKVQADLEHRWFYKNPATGVFEERDRISSSRMRVRGGREEGFRIYTKKRSLAPGKWRVETALKGGAVIGKKDFNVIEGVADENNWQVWKLK